MVLSHYLLDILIVFSTLISFEKRKIYAQKLFSSLGMIRILEEMFHLLSWSETSSQSDAEDEESMTHDSGKRTTHFLDSDNLFPLTFILHFKQFSRLRLYVRCSTTYPLPQINP